MKIVTFYSFKGGVGRSLSLVNVAYQLSERMGLNVGLLDLDLEACGLHQILKIDVPEGRDLLSLLDPNHRNLSEIEQFVFPIKFNASGVSRLFLLPSVADSKQLNKVTWNVNTQHFLTKELIPTFKKLYDLDYLLIDSRSGLSEFATFALKEADLEVLVCRLDAQNQYGMKRMVAICQAVQKPFKIIVVGCPRGYKPHLARFKKNISTDINFVIQYDHRLYFKEFIASKTNPQSQMAKSYRMLAANIREVGEHGNK